MKIQFNSVGSAVTYCPVPNIIVGIDDKRKSLHCFDADSFTFIATYDAKRHLDIDYPYSHYMYLDSVQCIENGTKLVLGYTNKQTMSPYGKYDTLDTFQVNNHHVLSNTNLHPIRLSIYSYN